MDLKSLNPLHLLLHASHANNQHLKVFEKNGRFGVGTDENNVPQWTFNTKAEADDYVRLAKDYDAEAQKAKKAYATAGPSGGIQPAASSVSQAAPNSEPTQSSANAAHQAAVGTDTPTK